MIGLVLNCYMIDIRISYGRHDRYDDCYYTFSPEKWPQHDFLSYCSTHLNMHCGMMDKCGSGVIDLMSSC